MIFKCQTQDLLNAVNKTSKVINKTTVMPILSRVLIQSEDNFLKLRGTDLGSTIDTIIEAEIIENGATTMDVKIFSEILNSLGEAEMEFASDKDEEYINITCNRAKFIIQNSITSDSYPTLDEVNKEEFISIERDLLKKGIELTKFSTSSDDMGKEFLTGIHLQTEDMSLKFTSTDNHRLSIFTCPIVEKTMDINAIIPATSAEMISKLLDEPGDTIKLYFTRNSISTNVDNSEYYGRLIESNYPDIRRVIPTDFNTSVILDRDNIYAALKRMEVASRENSYRAIFSTNDTSFAMSAENKEHSIKVTEEVDMVCEGVSVAMGVNVRYMKEAIERMNSEKIEIKIVSADRAFIIKMYGDDDFVHVLMPISIN